MNRVLHAGLHKTGSTFLQQEVFPALEGVVYVEDFPIRTHIPGLTKDSTILFSNEASCGCPYPVTREFSLDALRDNVILLQIDSLILFKRDFYSWVLSLYVQSLKEGGVLPLEEFIAMNKERLASWDGLEVKIAGFCRDENIRFLTLDYGEFINNGQSILDDVCDFIGCKRIQYKKKSVNASRYGLLTIRVFRLLNLLYKSKWARWLFRLLGITPRMLISSRRFGGKLERLSTKRLTASDVERLFV